MSRVETLSDIAQLQALEPEWKALYQDCPDAPPFLHPVWQLASHDLAEQPAICSIAIRRSGDLVALAACYLYREKLVFLGNGVSDRLGILARDKDAADVLIREMQRYALDLQELPASSPLLRLRHQPCSVSPALDLRDAIPYKLLNNLRQQKRYLSERGSVKFRTTASLDGLAEVFRLHEVRWRERGGGVLGQQGMEEFHARAAAAFSADGSLRIASLTLNDSPIAALYTFARAGVVYYYIGGFDPACDRFSPGSLLIEYAIETARAAGDHTFDFLRGSEPYKYRWGARDHQQYRICS